MKIKIAGLVNDSIVDGPGLRFAVFMQGCPHHCPGCHNPETHDPDRGKLKDTQEIIERIQKNPLLDGVTFTGGEPFMQPLPLKEMVLKVKEMGLDVVIYTGYTYEYLMMNPLFKEILSQADYLIDGPFLIDQRSLSLVFKGSKNQRTIDLRKSDIEHIVEADLSKY